MAIYIFLLMLWHMAITSAHMQLSWPYPLRSNLDPDTSYDKKDYNMAAPIYADGSNFPCKGYQNDQPKHSTAKYDAGQTYNISLEGSATHMGGSCQVSLSYDNGASFKVIKSIIGGCPLAKKYSFTVPNSAPQGTALLAWTWANKVGNREYYMNCAQVDVSGSNSASSDWKALPSLWVAQLSGVNSCHVSEGSNAVFSHPGNDVEYADGMSSSSPPTPGNCDSSGAVSVQSGNSQSQPASFTGVTSTGKPAIFIEGPSSLPSTSTLTSTSKSVTSYSAPTTTSTSSPTSSSAIASSSSSTTSSSLSVTTTSVLSVRSSSTSSAVGDSFANAPTAPPAFDLSTTRTGTTFTTAISYISAVSYRPATTGGLADFAGTNTVPYLPCIPGSLLCLSPVSFVTCMAPGHAYSDPIQVASGMECIPKMAPAAGIIAAHRDDLYSRLRPWGDCMDEGSLRCADDGKSFLKCNQGGWQYAGFVAEGTVCVGSKIQPRRL